jgi:hypothetical protein
MVGKLQVMTEKLASIILYENISGLYYVYEQALVFYIYMLISPTAHLGSEMTPDAGCAIR